MPVITLIALALVPQDPVVAEPAYEMVNAFAGQKKFDKPLYLDHHPTDAAHYYVVEQDGKVFRIPRDGDSGARHVFLDWEGIAYRKNWEEGLLGFAFDPSYADNRLFYIYYSRSPQRGVRESVISRLRTVDGEHGPVADPDSELELMVIPQPYGNHNGGTIVFGPDRMLYVALGDGGKANDPHDHGQNLTTLLGSVLRIDVRGATAEQPYAIPADNPFVGRVEDGVRGEIWCYGMRNPWRITFDRDTGDLWCGDVGQNAYEEIDRLVAGANYGWNWMEGTHRFALRPGDGEPPADLVAPVAEYGRKAGISVTGGYVYRGEEMPEINGFYIYADFITGRVWGVREDREGGAHEVRELCRAPSQVASFAELPDGELLALCFDGKIYRLTHAAE